MINRQTRDEAALICAASASIPRLFEDDTICPCMYCTGREFGFSYAASKLATDAMYAAKVEPGEFYYEERAAEAEAMLRTGWSPP